MWVWSALTEIVGLRNGRGVRVGVELAAGVAVGVGIGYGLDLWLGTSPWLLIVFFFLGSAGGMMNVWRAVGVGLAAGYAISSRIKGWITGWRHSPERKDDAGRVAAVASPVEQFEQNLATIEVGTLDLSFTNSILRDAGDAVVAVFLTQAMKGAI